MNPFCPPDRISPHWLTVLISPTIIPVSSLTPFGLAAGKMGYENHVYLAKLAEQAERYEGKTSLGVAKISTVDARH